MNKVMKQFALAAVVGAGLFAATVPTQAAFSKYTPVQAQAAISYDRAVEIFKADIRCYKQREDETDGIDQYQIDNRVKHRD